MNFNFKNISDVATFDKLKEALQHNFNELLSKGYLYKGDMGETPQIFNRPLIEKGEWTALGKSIIGEIFKDTKNKKYKNYYDENSKVVDIDRLIAELTKDGKLDGLNGATYPWWCADGISDYPIYPATYFVYIDFTPNNIRNNDDRWKDNPYGKWEDDSCVLIPADVKYNDYRDGAPEEEREPIVIYHKNHIYPTFYFDPNAKGAAAGAWCWEINGVQTGVPASVANDDGSVLGHMFIFKKDDTGIYHYKAGVDATDKWMTRQEMIDKELRYPINGDIGFTIEKVKETNGEETGGDSTTITSVNTLQIYNFVEDDKDSVNVNGGDWGRGGNLISFGESFYKALWEFISSDSRVEINKGKIILAANSGKHCIFVKNGDSPTLVLMPLNSKIDPTSKEDFEDNETWSDAKLQLNYPETTINGKVNIDDNLEVSKNIKADSINTTEDISCKSINASGDISTESSISCNEISANNFAVNDSEIIIGSNKARVNITSPNFNVTNDYIDTKLPFNSNNTIKVSETKTPEEYIKISNTHVLTEQTQLKQSAVETKSTTETIISGGDNISESNVSGSYVGSGTSATTVKVKYESKYELSKAKDIKSITLSMPRSLGLSIQVVGGVSYGSAPLLKSGEMTLRLFAKNKNTGEDEKLCEPTQVPIAGNSSSGFSKSNETKWCTIYCSFTSSQLNDASLKLTQNRSNYGSIYITAEATFNLGVDKGTWGAYHNAIYEAGKACKLYSCNLNSSGGSIWTSGAPANYSSGIFKVSTTKLENVDSDNGITTVSICPDGILIGKASNKSAVIYIDKDGGFHIEYHIPKVGDKNTKTETINVLSISTAGIGTCKSDVFALKSEIPKSS